MSNDSLDMRDSSAEMVFDFLRTRAERVRWLHDNGFYEDAELLHEDTLSITRELDLV